MRDYRYGHVAWCYDELATLYSGGRIDEVKAAQITEIAVGDRVLYAGAGRGRDALAAARAGARVTCLDSSAPMLRRLRARSRREHCDVEVIHGDLFAHRGRAYDVVTANFVLNVFGPVAMKRALFHLASLVEPGGRLMIADFAPPRRERFALETLYYRPLNVAGWILRICDLHPIYDYASVFEECGLELVSSSDARPLFGRVVYESLVARRGLPVEG